MEELKDKFLNEEHIKYHFILNPNWGKLYETKFPNAKCEDYFKNFYKLLIDNGYSFSGIKYKKFLAYKEVSCFNPKGEEIICYGDLSVSGAYGQLMIGLICDWLIDFKTLN